MGNRLTALSLYIPAPFFTLRKLNSCPIDPAPLPPRSGPLPANQHPSRALPGIPEARSATPATQSLHPRRLLGVSRPQERRALPGRAQGGIRSILRKTAARNKQWGTETAGNAGVRRRRE